MIFGPLGQPLSPSLDTMTPEQFVHTMTFREQGFTSDKMPQYRDHTEASQDVGEAVTTEASALSSEQSSDKLLTFNPRALSQPNLEMFWENKHFADCKIVCKGESFNVCVILCIFHICIFNLQLLISDSGGEEVLTHRLVLAAYNDYFYQLLSSTASQDQNMDVILMPDYNREDVSNMVQQLYNFKVELYCVGSEKNNSSFNRSRTVHFYWTKVYINTKL